MTAPPAADSTRISSLEGLLRAQAGRGPAPVERWNPPYCGDIGMRIRGDGSWHYQGSPIGRPALVKLFAGVLRRDADGRHYLVTPAEKVDVMVDDAPFLAVEMEVAGSGPDQRLLFRTNVDDVVACDATHPLWFRPDPRGDGLKPYLRVRGRLAALVTRALYYDLVDIATAEHVDGRDQLALCSGGARFPIEVGPDLLSPDAADCLRGGGAP